MGQPGSLVRVVLTFEVLSARLAGAGVPLVQVSAVTVTVCVLVTSVYPVPASVRQLGGAIPLLVGPALRGIAAAIAASRLVVMKLERCILSISKAGFWLCNILELYA